MNQKGFANIILVLVVVALLGAGGYLLFLQQSIPSTKEQPAIYPTGSGEETQDGGKEKVGYCTQELKDCPDGSYVGRQPPTCEFAPCPESEKKDKTDSWKLFMIGAGGGGGGGIVEIPTKITFKYPDDLLTECAPTGPFPNLISRDLDPQKCWYQESEVSPPSFVSQLGSFGDESAPPITDLKKWRMEDWAADYKPNEDTVLKDSSRYGIAMLEERTSTKVITYIATGNGRVFSFSYFPITEDNETLYQDILSTIAFVVESH